MILIGTDGGIYRWFEGAGWPVFHSLQDRPIVGLDSPGAGVLVALDRAGQVYESVNNGQEWRTIPLAQGSGTPTTLALLGQPQAIVLAARPLGLYRRAIGLPVPLAERTRPVDQSFRPVFLHHARTVAEGATALVSRKAAPPRVDAKTAGQAGWTRLGAPSVGGSGGSPEIRALAAGTGDAALWYAAVQGAGLWRSSDLGATWQACAGLPAEVHAIRTTAARPGSVYAATSDGCWVSTDAGQTWEDRSTGLEQARHVTAVDVKPGAPDVLLAGAATRPEPSPPPEYSLYESTNGGKSWALVRRGLPDAFQGDPITDIRHDPSAPENVVLALASGELWVTRNAGAYWMPLARQTRSARVLCAVS